MNQTDTFTLREEVEDLRAQLRVAMEMLQGVAPYGHGWNPTTGKHEYHIGGEWTGENVLKKAIESAANREKFRPKP